ncbi:Methyltransferase domain-containing protein [Mucilaginibacter gossypiicola]|uniref:Methyltransferase domain-containing protein n=1 Tax=Mucilaginibacter gossypiicola TaxID=551995 RepID=A0A1H8PW83_9SPHI|nr:class I SAM-dependent methyltransferase [Mucilaginibacter gossypiicola]SEO46056.1 Methyltransferase domain-containing protein [Mucilaginibacter gossypiicola]
MAANYNNSAWFYDRLSRLVYGRALINAQVYLLGFIPPKSKILIAGGGTGWILEELAKIHSSGLDITYVEISANMTALSQKRHTGENTVTFVNDAVENVRLPAGFDVVVTPFLFDNFVDETVDKVFYHSHNLLKPNGLWLNADFQLTGRWWQNVMLQSMFVFFRLLCGIEASRLPAIEKRFDAAGYNVIEDKTFFGDFIVARVYRKQSS